MTPILEVKTTTADHASARRIAETLVARRLAACVQIGGPIESIYRWQGNVETSQEWLCTAKTTQEAYPHVEQCIRELHSYDEPEIVATEVVTGSVSYLKWLQESVLTEGP